MQSNSPASRLHVKRQNKGIHGTRKDIRVNFQAKTHRDLTKGLGSYVQQKYYLQQGRLLVDESACPHQKGHYLRPKFIYEGFLV